MFDCFGLNGFGQTKKSLAAKKISDPIRIDGKLDELVWSEAEIAKDFVMLEPGLGDLEPENQKSQIRILYDNEALYVGAYLYDSDPQSSSTIYTKETSFDTRLLLFY